MIRAVTHLSCEVRFPKNVDDVTHGSKCNSNVNFLGDASNTTSGGSAVGRRLANLGYGMEFMCATPGHSSICTKSPRDTRGNPWLPLVRILLVLLVARLLLLKYEIWDPEC